MFKNLYQVFYNADGAEAGSGTVDHIQDDNTELSGDDMLQSAIRDLLAAENSEESDEEDTSEETEEVEDVEETDDEDVEDEEQDLEEEEEEVPVEKPKKQSKEENARFAAERRQRELDAKIQAEVERLRQESPEFRLAKQLAERSGLTPEAMLEQMREAQLKEEAERTGQTLESLKEREANKTKMADMERQMNQLRFENWNNKIERDTERLQKEYSFLTKEDFAAATDYILNTVRNVDLPLEDAVYAVHGKKIVENLSKAKVQDDLAKQSGRSKKTPPSPNNGKPSKIIDLTADEKYAAKAMGVSEEDYLKYKNM